MKKYLFTLFIIIYSPSAFSQLDISNLSVEIQKKIKEKFPNYEKTYSIYKLDQILKYVSQTQGREKARLIHLPLKSKYQIKISRYIVAKDIKFKGNKGFSSRKLLKILGLQRGLAYNRSQIVKSAENIKIFYQNQGYFRVSVRLEIKNYSNQKSSIAFKINENQASLLSAIEINTPNQELKNTLNNLFIDLKGKAFTQERIDEIGKIARDYFRQSNYILAKIRHEKTLVSRNQSRITLKLRITHPVKYEFEITGNKRYSLSTILRVMGIKKYYNADSSPLNQMKQRLMIYYLNQGFSKIKIKILEDLKNKFHKLITFRITEGLRVQIYSISVAGNISRSSKYYTKFIENNSSALIKDGYFNKKDLENGYKNLIIHLRNQGFLKAKIQFSRIDYEDRGYAKILVVLNEGQQTKISSISFKGNKQFSNKELLEASGLGKEEILDFNEFEKSLQRIKDYYLSRGYLEMKFLSKDKESFIKYEKSNLKGHISYTISEGFQSQIQSISIKGNSLTKDRTILDQITFKEKDILTFEKIRESKENLSRLGLFTLVDIQKKVKANGKTNITIMIEERDPGQFRLGLGVNSQLGLTLRAYSGISYTNISGTRRAAGARLDISAVEQARKISKKFVGRLNLNYLEPNIFETPVDGKLNLTSERNIYNIFSDRIDLTESQRIEFILEKQFSKEIKLNWFLWTKEFQKFYSSPNINNINSARDIHLAALGPSLEMDFRDSPFLPTKGKYFRFSTQYYSKGLGSSNLINFLKSDADFRIYFSPKRKFVWANSIRGGYIKNMHSDENSGIPFSKSFFLGGQSTIRGFGGSRGIEKIPNNLIIEINPQKPDQLIKTRYISYGLIKSELRFPIYNIFSGAIFYDGGGVFIQGKIQQKSFRQGYGFGFRINTPVGPLSLDFAWKVSPQTYPDGQSESPFRIHFSIGTF